MKKKDESDIREECKCREWKRSMESLDACVLFAWAHDAKYEGKFFNFCPWCSKKLKIIKK